MAVVISVYYLVVDCLLHSVCLYVLVFAASFLTMH
jgi:hypothetical protein